MSHARVLLVDDHNLVRAGLRSLIDAMPGIGAGPLDSITPRQREVLKLIAEGLGTKSMAFRLGVSVKTVETHRAQLMERLDIHDVPGLVRFAVRSGLVSADA